MRRIQCLPPLSLGCFAVQRLRVRRSTRLGQGWRRVVFLQSKRGGRRSPHRSLPRNPGLLGVLVQADRLETMPLPSCLRSDLRKVFCPLPLHFCWCRRTHSLGPCRSSRCARGHIPLVRIDRACGLRGLRWLGFPLLGHGCERRGPLCSLFVFAQLHWHHRAAAVRVVRHASRASFLRVQPLPDTRRFALPAIRRHRVRCGCGCPCVPSSQRQVLANTVTVSNCVLSDSSPRASSITG